MNVLIRRPVTLAGAALLGWGLSRTVNTAGFVDSPAYLTGAALLLGVGLLGSTRDINLTDLRDRFGTVLSAVTIGVLAKAGLIVAVMYAASRDPMAIVLGIAVAQIDPLAVAAVQRGDRLSPRAQSILGAWASFDDPATVLLTVYASAIALSLSGRTAHTSLGTSGEGLGRFAIDLGRNAVFVAVAWLLWRAVRRLAGGARTFRRRTAADGIGLALLAVLVVVAAFQFLMLGLAVTGLFFRPPVGRVLKVGSDVAFHIAAFGLGLLLVNGVKVGLGLLLAVAAVGAHALVSVPISRGLGVRDRAYLATGQQNGMTAVILALLLDRNFKGVVGIVAPAVVGIAVIHAVSNGLLDRYFRPASGAHAITGSRQRAQPQPSIGAETDVGVSRAAAVAAS